jgi:hypothetical protein
MGDKFHPKLNISRMPIANKYREGKMKRTLKRELKVPEIAEREAVERNFLQGSWAILALMLCKGGRCVLLFGCTVLLVSASFGGWNSFSSC